MRACFRQFLSTIREVFWVVVFSALLLHMVLNASAAWGQDASTGALRGVVLDAQGAAITNADIVAIRIETGIRYHTATDSQGRFVLDLLPPGHYSARAEAEGMSPEISLAIRVETGAAVSSTFRLKVAGPRESITVSDAPRIIETTPSSVSTLVDERAIKDLPLNGRRFTDLLLLTPGVTQDPRGLTSGSNGDLSYGGIRGYNNSFLVDGSDDNNGFFAQAAGRYRAPYQFSNEVVQEFRVTSSGYGTESGRAGGAVVNVVTKSGTNHWHGSTFYFLRDSAFGGASPPFVGSNPSTQQNQFGATVGGPIQRDKTFLFAGYDQHIEHAPSVVQFDNGQTVVVPQPGTDLTPGDYNICDPAIGGQACDQPLVFASAAQLSTMAGTFPASLMANTGFIKLDRVLAPNQFLTARVSTSRYYGANNVFFNPGNPITNYAESGNGEENVKTESASLGLTSGLTPRLTSHLRAQFSRDLEESFPNSIAVRTNIYSWMEDFGQSSLLPRQTREHRLSLAETMSFTHGRNQWKFGGDGMLTWDYNYFPSLYGGEFLYDDIVVNPFTFVPQHGGLALTPLRAWAHGVPRYYVQNFGNPVSRPNSNDVAGFVQDTVRLTPHLTLSAGARYDLQTFAKSGMVSDPLWPAAGKMPSQETNFAPRLGIGYALGGQRPIMVRTGFGIFYTRIPQIYESAVMNDNGVNNSFVSLDSTNFYQAQVFPTYPNTAFQCVRGPVSCAVPNSLKQFSTNEVAAFSPSFQTPRVQQGSVSLEREVVDGFTMQVSYLYVHGVDLIRARDVNLPPPAFYSYPIFDPTGSVFQNSFYNVESFATQQNTYSISCPFPPCINTLSRPISQLGAIDEFESAASSVYHGLTVSLHKRMSGGLYFRLAYTWAHAIDNGQDALVAGQPATVQNSYAANSERASSVTDQRQRLTMSAIEEPHLFDDGQKISAALFNHWRISGIMTYGSGRPTNATVSGDPNQDGNTSNDRLSGYGRNAFLGPDYASMDLRAGRMINLSPRYHLELNAEAFNVFNRDNKNYVITDNGFVNSAGRFVQFTQSAGGTYYPAYYQQPTSFLKPTSSFAPRQMQVSMRLNF